MRNIPKAGEVFRGDDGTVSIILPDQYTPDYDPPEEELHQYAEYLGIDVEKEPELLPLAKEGLCAPLPPEWKACQTEGNERYYFNFCTGESLWDHPLDDDFRARVVEERRKLQAQAGNGSKRSKKKATPAVSGRPKLEKGAGNTKAIANSLFCNATIVTVPPVTEGGPKASTRQGRLGALGSEAGSSSVPLDLSDLMYSKSTSSGISSTGATLRTSTGLSGGLGGSAFLRECTTSRTGLLPSASDMSSAPVQPMSTKEIEAAIRRRLEEKHTSSRRAMTISMEKAVADERGRLETELKAERARVEEAWETERRKSAMEMQVGVANEVQRMSEQWTKRLQESKGRLEELQREVDTKTSDMEKVGPPLTMEERKQRTAKEHESAVRARRELLRREADAAVARTIADNKRAVEFLTKTRDETIAAAKQRAVEEQTRQLNLLRAQCEKMLSLLREEVAELTTSLEGQQAEEATRSSSAPAVTSSTPGAAGTTSDSTIPVAEADLVSLVERTTSECRSAKESAMRDYQKQYDALNAEIEKVEQAADHAPRSEGPPVVLPVPSLSSNDAKRLEDEEAELQRDLTEARQQYAAQTQAMVGEKRKLGTPGDSGKAVGDATKPTAAAIKAAQEAERVRHTAAMGEVAQRHQQRMSQLRQAHLEKVEMHMGGSAGDDPRRSSTYNRLLTAKKESWLAANPEPPVRTSEAGTSADEVQDLAKIVEPHVATIRDEMRKGQQQQLQELETLKKESLRSTTAQYRERMIAAARQRIAHAAQQRGMSSGGLLPTNSVHKQRPHELLAQQEAEIKQMEENYERTMQQLRERIDQQEVLLAAAMSQQQMSGDGAAEPGGAIAPRDTDSYITVDAAQAEERMISEKRRCRLDVLRNSIQAEMFRFRTLLATVSSGSPSAIPRLGDAGGRELPDIALEHPRAMSDLPPTAPATGASHPHLAIHSSSPMHTMNSDVPLAVPGVAGPGSRTPQRRWASPGANSLMSPPRLGFADLSSIPKHSSNGTPLRMGRTSVDTSLRVDGRATANASQCGNRLAYLRERLRERREWLRARQEQLLMAREEWRRDMALCTKHRDYAQAKLLRHAKLELENWANALNSAVLELKDLSASLRDAHSQQRLLGSTDNRTSMLYATPFTMGPILPSPPLVADGSDSTEMHVVSLLTRLLDQTERLEGLVMNSTERSHSHSITPSHRSKRTGKPILLVDEPPHPSTRDHLPTHRHTISEVKQTGPATFSSERTVAQERAAKTRTPMTGAAISSGTPMMIKSGAPRKLRDGAVGSVEQWLVEQRGK